MAEWGPQESANAARLIRFALEEDLGETGDLTSALLPADLQGRAVFVARADGTVAGLPVIAMVYAALSGEVVVTLEAEDSVIVRPGTRLAMVAGPVRAILTGERTALNFVQRLSGVATLTRPYVEAIAGLNCRILDTRKTTPGWRHLEKYAVRCGGGTNHRRGLFDGVLIKDNHLAALRGRADALGEAVALARRSRLSVPVEVEIETPEQLDDSLRAQPDVIMLDNMDLPAMRQAVVRRNQLAPAVKLEASGGVTLGTVRAIAETGVDFISVGALTHSAPALDIALDFQWT